MMEYRSDQDSTARNGPGELEKSSDFSIDYILNKAGSKSEKSAFICETLGFKSVHFQNQMIKMENSTIPMFDWLHYTRYRPPKLPRPVRTGPIKRAPGRLPRVPFTPGQLAALEAAYKISTYLSSEEVNKLAVTLNLTSTRVKIWFQNRRARERREKRVRSPSNSESDDSSP